MAKLLTAKTIEHAKPGAKRVEISDAGARGLHLVIQPSGGRSWAVRYRRPDGKPAKFTLGSVLVLKPGEAEPVSPKVGAPLTLTGARKLAAEAMHQLGQGIDPAGEKKREKVATAKARDERERDKIEVLAEAFIEKYAKPRQRAWQATQRLFKNEILPKWKDRNVGDIKRRDIVELLEAIAAKRPVQCNRVHAAIRRFFWWLSDREVIAASPAIGIEPKGTEVEREHVLSDEEIRSAWIAAGDLPAPTDSFVRLLLLLGQRRCEVSGMRWDELSLDLYQAIWTIPGSRTKNARTHVVPLSKQAVAVIKDIKRIHSSPFVLTTYGDVPIRNFAVTKQRLDDLMPKARPWRFHDLRRSCATWLQKSGVRQEVTEAILNHANGKLKGVGKIYQRHDFAPEKIIALQRWADHLEALATGKKPADGIADLAKVRARRRAKESAHEGVRR